MLASGLCFFSSLVIPADPLTYKITHFLAHADVREANKRVLSASVWGVFSRRSSTCSVEHKALYNFLSLKFSPISYVQCMTT